MTTDPQPTQTPTTPVGRDPRGPARAGHHTAGPAPAARPAGRHRAGAGAAQHTLKRTRISGLWVAVGCFAVILLLLLIFILQNSQKVDISYMGAHGHLPLGVALLFAAVCGVILVVLAGTARISQLRTTARRHRRVDAKRAKAAASEPANPVR